MLTAASLTTRGTVYVPGRESAADVTDVVTVCAAPGNNVIEDAVVSPDQAVGNVGCTAKVADEQSTESRLVIVRLYATVAPDTPLWLDGATLTPGALRLQTVPTV